MDCSATPNYFACTSAAKEAMSVDTIKYRTTEEFPIPSQIVSEVFQTISPRYLTIIVISITQQFIPATKNFSVSPNRLRNIGKALTSYFLDLYSMGCLPETSGST